MLTQLRTFGCQAYMTVTRKESKLEDRATKGIMMGYSRNTPGYKIWNLESNRMELSRDVTFDETILPGISLEDTQDPTSSLENLDPPMASLSPSFTNNSSHPEIETFELPTQSEESASLEQPAESSDPSTLDGQQAVDEDQNPAPRRSSRIGTNPSGIWSPGWNTGPSINLVAEATKDDTPIPQTFNDAICSPEAGKWIDAMNEEMKCICNAQTWDLVELPSGSPAIGCKWVYSIKSNSHGYPIRYKARLVAKGYAQQAGIDYGETFAPVVTLTSIRMVLSLSVHLDLQVHQMDVKSAFLNGKLDEVVYMEQPPGYIETPGRVCKLQKALYGLKQAPRAWNQEIHQTFSDMGFKRSQGDPSFYFKHSSDAITLVPLFVDDLLIASNSIKEIEDTKSTLSARYSMKDMGPVSMILGMEIERQSSGGLVVHQSKFTKDLLREFKMDQSKATKSPMEPGLHLPPCSEVVNEVEVKRYQTIVGKLLYLSNCTRPDICFVVSYLSRFCHKPGTQHWAAVKRVLRYLRGTEEIGLKFQRNSKVHLEGYSDADWGGDQNDRKSTTGFIFFIGEHPIAWGSKKQGMVALSTMEAEYIALAKTCQEGLWIHSILTSIVDYNIPLHVGVDNQPAIATATLGRVHGRSKHISLKYHFIQDLVEKRLVKIRYVPTQAMRADILTKSVGGPKHTELTKLVCGYSTCADQRGV